MTEPFESKILTIIPAHPDAYLRTTITELYPDKRENVTTSDKLRIIAWATVERHYPGEPTDVEVEAVFIEAGRPMHETAYRYVHSELHPKADNPKVVVSFEYDLIY
ncbi:hypothetical protein [Streptomyces sp. NPDC051214]|uniref:hypothetical protein n=1 Tax=Streptomyces sp. NPDC051214 TaxID=3155282 RepID=UPI0034124A8B